jgi:hypothetical protein
LDRGAAFREEGCSKLVRGNDEETNLNLVGSTHPGKALMGLPIARQRWPHKMAEKMWTTKNKACGTGRPWVWIECHEDVAGLKFQLTHQSARGSCVSDPGALPRTRSFYCSNLTSRFKARKKKISSRKEPGRKEETKKKAGRHGVGSKLLLLSIFEQLWSRKAKLLKHLVKTVCSNVK